MCPTKGAVFGKSWPLSHHVWLENKGFLQSISRKNDEYRKPKSDIILMNTLSIEGMFPGFPSCFQLYIVSCWIYFRFLAVFSNVPSCFSTFAAGLPISRFFFHSFLLVFPYNSFCCSMLHASRHCSREFSTSLAAADIYGVVPPWEGWFNHENGGLSLTYMGLSTEQEILVPSYLAKWRFTSRLTGLYGRYIYS